MTTPKFSKAQMAFIKDLIEDERKKAKTKPLSGAFWVADEDADYAFEGDVYDENLEPHKAWLYPVESKNPKSPVLRLSTSEDTKAEYAAKQKKKKA